MNIQEKEFSKTVRLPDELNCKLEKSIRTKEIQAIWYDKTARTEYHILWLKVKDKKEIEKSFSVDFQNTVLNERQILMVLLNDCDFEFASAYNDFILVHLLRDNNCLYNTEKISLSTHSGHSDLKKLLSSYEEKYLMLKKISDQFIKERLQGAWQFMIKAFTNDITYLELMLFGTSFESKTITQRLLILELFIPEVKKLLVKKNEEAYFLIDYITNDDDSGYYDDFGKSLQKIQKQFFILINKTYAIYINDSDRNKSLQKVQNFGLYDHELMNHKALDHLKKFDEVEELFLFHQITTFDSNQKHEHFYVFVVLKHKATKDLKTYLQHIEQNPIDNVHITSICYTRYQIQNELYEYQCFFKKTMKSKNKIYSSDYYPKMHWFNRKISYFDDLFFLLNQNIDTYNNEIKPIFENKTTVKYISSKVLADILAKQLQLFVFSQVIIKPQTTNLQTLFDLVIFANPNVFIEFTTQENNQLIQLIQTIQSAINDHNQLIFDNDTFSIIDKLISSTTKFINV